MTDNIVWPPEGSTASYGGSAFVDNNPAAPAPERFKLLLTWGGKDSHPASISLLFLEFLIKNVEFAQRPFCIENRICILNVIAGGVRPGLGRWCVLLCSFLLQQCFSVQ